MIRPRDAALLGATGGVVAVLFLIVLAGLAGAVYCVADRLYQRAERRRETAAMHSVREFEV